MLKKVLPFRPFGISMTKVDLKGVGHYRVDLPKVQWVTVKTFASWLGKSPKEIVEEALWDYLEEYDCTLKVRGEKVIEKGIPVSSVVEKLTSVNKEDIVINYQDRGGE